MNHAPVISHVLIVPGLPTSAADSLQDAHFQSISFGLVINDNHVVWGEYRPNSSSSDMLSILRQKIVPLLEGRPLEAHRDIMDELDGVTETAVLTQPIAPSQSGSISRRAFLTGNLKSTVKTEQVVVERPLSPTLRYCVSQTLLTALALEQNLTVAELIATTYNQFWQPAPVSIHLEIDTDTSIPDATILSPQIQSLGYNISSDNPHSQLGPNGERLQRFIRQLTELIDRVTASDYRPTIHLNIAGGLGHLLDHNIGRILGALYGLEQATKPYPLRITDPALLENSTQQIEFNRQLMDYIRMRGMKTELAANHSIQSLADAERFVKAGAVHLVEISPPRLGTVRQSIQAIQTCRQAQIGILLRDPTHPFATQLALGIQPDLMTAFWGLKTQQNIDEIYSEMARVIAWNKRTKT